LLCWDRDGLGRRTRSGSHWCRHRRLRRGLRRLSAVRAYLARYLGAGNGRNALRQWTDVRATGHDGALNRTQKWRWALNCAYRVRRALNSAELLRRALYCAYRVRWALNSAQVLRRALYRAYRVRRTLNSAQVLRRARNAVWVKWRGRRAKLEGTVTLRRHRENCREGEAGAARPSCHSCRCSTCLGRGRLGRIEICICVHRLITSLFPCVGNDR
jgi:hypothetical protein